MSHQSMHKTRGLDNILCRFSIIFYMRENVTSCFAFLHFKLLLKRVYSMGSKFFPFRVDPFQKRQKQSWQIASAEVYSFHLIHSK